MAKRLVVFFLFLFGLSFILNLGAPVYATGCWQLTRTVKVKEGSGYGISGHRNGYVQMYVKEPPNYIYEAGVQWTVPPSVLYPGEEISLPATISNIKVKSPIQSGIGFQYAFFNSKGYWHIVIPASMLGCPEGIKSIKKEGKAKVPEKSFGGGSEQIELRAWADFGVGKHVGYTYYYTWQGEGQIGDFNIIGTWNIDSYPDNRPSGYWIFKKDGTILGLDRQEQLQWTGTWKTVGKDILFTFTYRGQVIWCLVVITSKHTINVYDSSSSGTRGKQIRKGRNG